MRVQLAARQHRLEQVAGVHRALGRARPDDRVQLVDEQDDLALGVLDLLEDRLQPLLELAAELGARDQRAQVQRHDALVLEPLRDVAAHDPLGEALDDRGLADARLADEHRVVLRAPREHLDRAADLLVAADDRIELARTRLLRQVAAVLLERLVGRLRVLARHALAAPNAGERLEEVPRARRRTSRAASGPRRRPRRRRAAGARWRRTRRSGASPRPRPAP